MSPDELTSAMWKDLARRAAEAMDAAVLGDGAVEYEGARVVPTVKHGGYVLVSNNADPVELLAPLTRRQRARYFLRRRWWGIKRLPGYRLVHKDEIGCPRCD